MATFKDILLENPTGGFLFKNGDFSIGASDQQHIFDIINDNPGEWQETPNVGVGVIKYVNGSDIYRLNRDIKLQLTNDGYNVDKIIIKLNPDSTLDITPNATRP